MKCKESYRHDLEGVSHLFRAILTAAILLSLCPKILLLFCMTISARLSSGRFVEDMAIPFASESNIMAETERSCKRKNAPFQKTLPQ